MAQFVKGDGILRGLLRSCSHRPGLRLDRGQIWGSSRLSKERKTGNKGQTRKSCVAVGLEQTHGNLLHKWDSLFVAIRNRVWLFVAYMCFGGPNKLTHRRILRGEPIKSASNTAAGGVQRLGSLTALSDECLYTKERTET
jgi:hypothetical protein